MTRTLSAPTIAKIDSANWEPGFLVQLTLSQIVRFSTRDAVTWLGNIYVPAVLEVQNLLDDSSGGTLQFRDPTLAIQSLVRVESLIGKPVAIARFYAGATGSTDPFWFFSGCIQSASEGTPPQVTINVSRDAAQRSLSPSKRIGKATGFNVMAPEGQIIRFRQSSFRLERART